MKLQVIILGSGSSVGVPRIDNFWGNCNKNQKKNIRTRCSALIKKGKNIILIDTSPDLKKQLLDNKIEDISSVIFTHEHADQTNGLFELRPFFWKYKKRINIYADKRTIQHLKKTQFYLFKHRGDYPAIVKSNFIKPKFSLGKSENKISFKSILVKHGRIKSVAYVFEKIAYISDSNDLSIVNKNIFKNLSYLILDCLKYNKHPSHFNLDQALYIHQKLKPKKTILTNLHYDIDYKKLSKKLPKNVHLAYDGYKINL
tara:strand:- start:5530 stop:6300 length:771 start_codon:yes stop_codon:yes gene_type:complete